MRPELELMEQIDLFLDGKMNAEELEAFEAKISSDPILKNKVETQRDLREGIKDLGLKLKIQNAGRKFKKLKLTKGLLIGLGVAVLLVGTFLLVRKLWKEEVTEHTIVNTDREGWESEAYSLSMQTDTILITEDKVVISIPDDAFLLDGEVVKDVELAFKSALKPEDIIKAGLSTASNGALLETGGMFEFNAFKDGRLVTINPESPVVLSVPTDELKAGMSLYEGDIDSTGFVNWVNPVPLDNPLTPADILSLDFYPPNYVKTAANEGYDPTDKKILDSVFYSYYCENSNSEELDNPMIIGDEELEDSLTNENLTQYVTGQMHFRGQCESCHSLRDRNSDLSLKNVVERRSEAWLKSWISNPSAMIESGDDEAKKLYERFRAKHGLMQGYGYLGDYNINSIIEYLRHNGQSPFPKEDEVNAGCGVQPASIEAIWNKKYQKTLIATKEFEERLPWIYNSCNEEVLMLYVQNLNEPMWKLDSIACTLTYSEETWRIGKRFKAFYEQRKGGIAVSSRAQRKLNNFFEKSAKAQFLAAMKAIKAVLDEQARLYEESANRHLEHAEAEYTREEKNFQAEYDLNLEHVKKELGIPDVVPVSPRYTVTVTSNGAKNIDQQVFESTENRETTTFSLNGRTATITYEPVKVTLSNESEMDFVRVYALPKELYSFERMKKKGTAYEYKFNGLIDYEIVAVGYKGDEVYVYHIGKVDPPAEFVFTLEKSSEKALKKLLKSNGTKQERRDIIEDLDFEKFKIKDERRRRDFAARERSRWRIHEVVLPCEVMNMEEVADTVISAGFN